MEALLSLSLSPLFNPSHPPWKVLIPFSLSVWGQISALRVLFVFFSVSLSSLSSGNKKSSSHEQNFFACLDVNTLCLGGLSKASSLEMTGILSTMALENLLFLGEGEGESREKRRGGNTFYLFLGEIHYSLASPNSVLDLEGNKCINKLEKEISTKRILGMIRKRRKRTREIDCLRRFSGRTNRKRERMRK